MAYEQKLEKLGKIAATIGAMVADDPELRLKILNSEDDEMEGFSVVVVLRYEPRGMNDIL